MAKALREEMAVQDKASKAYLARVEKSFRRDYDGELPAPEQLAPLIRELRRDGYSFNGMAVELEKREVPTPGGGKWHRQIVKLIVQRLAA